MWDAAARAPAFDRPAFTATIGVVRATRRAMLANRRGLPKDSTYSRTASVFSSCSHHSRRSLPEMSALLPTDRKALRPMPRRSASSIAARPRPPLCVSSPSRPGRGGRGANVASSATAGSLLRTPMQFGPTSRMPLDPADPSELGLPRRAVGAGLGEARREHDERAHTALRARAREADNRRRGDGEDGELDRARHVVKRSERRSALHLVRVVVDEMQRSAVARGEDVVHKLPGDRAAAAGGADDHDAVGLEQVPDAR